MNKSTYLHRNSQNLLLLFGLIVGMGILSSCGTTTKANNWVDPSYKAAPMDKIMVIAIRKDPVRRRMWEDAIVADINSTIAGRTQAVASYQFYPNELPDTNTVLERTKDEGCDGVLIVARAERDTVFTTVPGTIESAPITRYNRRWDTYSTTYRDVYVPGYTELETTVSVRTDLMIPKSDGTLVWTMTSQSVDPGSAEQFRSSVARSVAGDLKRKHFID